MGHAEEISQIMENLKAFAENPFSIHFQCSPDNRLAPEHFDYHVHEFWELKISIQDSLISLHAPETVHCSTAPDMVFSVTGNALLIGEWEIVPPEKYLQILKMQLDALNQMQHLAGSAESIRHTVSALQAMILNILQQYAFCAVRYLAEQKMEIRALDYLQKHYYHSDLSVNDAARYLNISPQTLNGILRRTTGMSLRKHLIRIRIEQAERLLTNPDYLVKEVAALTGWRSAYYFCNSFRKHRKLSPQEWRQKYFQNPKNAAALP